MNGAEICLKLNQMPLVLVADQMYAERPFLHADRRTGFHVLLYVIQGAISIVEEDTEYEVNAGSLFFLKAGLHHYGVTPSAPNTKWMFVHFLLEQPEREAQERAENFGQLMAAGHSGEFNTEFRPYTSHLQGQEFIKADYEYTVRLPKLHSIPKGSTIESKLHHLVEWFHSPHPLRAGYMNPLLQEILLDCYVETEHESVYPNQEIIYEIIHDLETHTQENFSARRIEEVFHLSYKHLCRIFKQATGRTLTQYHTELRINEASRLLRETTSQISDISSLMGFADPLYFSNVFKKINGLSPRSYRQQYMAGDREEVKKVWEEEETEQRAQEERGQERKEQEEQEREEQEQEKTEREAQEEHVSEKRPQRKELESWLL